MRGSLRALVTPDSRIERLSGLPIAGGLLPASDGMVRGWSAGSQLNVPATWFKFNVGSTLFVSLYRKPDAAAPGTQNIVWAKGASSYPQLGYDAVSGIKFTPYSGATSIASSVPLAAGVVHNIWVASRAGQHVIVVNGVEVASSSAAGFENPSAVTGFYLEPINANTIWQYAAIFNKFLTREELAEIDRDPSVLSRSDVATLFFVAQPLQLVAADASAAGVASSAQLVQGHSLAAAAAVTATLAATAAIGSVVVLAGAGATSSGVVAASAIGQRHVLVASVASSGELASAPGIAQGHSLLGANVAAGTAAVAPAIGGAASVLVAAGVAVDSVAQASPVVQRHLLASGSAATAVRASTASIGGATAPLGARAPGSPSAALQRSARPRSR